jgi:leucyl aminopeptidase (aminopeptidase T)
VSDSGQTVQSDYASPSWRQLAGETLRQSLDLRRGNSVLVETTRYSLDFAEILAGQARRLGMRPLIFFAPEREVYENVTGLTPLDANAIARGEVEAAKVCDGYVTFSPSPEDLRRREKLPEAHRRALYRRQSEWGQTLARHAIPSVLLLAASATPAAAKEYRVDLDGWRKECFQACAVNPAQIRRAGAPVARRLQRGRRLSVTHPNGTHLELKLSGRKPILDDGAVDAHDLAQGRNWTTVPSGYLLVVLDEKSAEGQFYSNRPSRHHRGVIQDITWNFRDGKLYHYEVGKGRSIFESSFSHAGRERNRPALLSIGLNPQIHDFPFAEDQEAGVVTLYIGCNDDLGGRTHGSYRDYALLRGADLTIDDQPVVREGRLV